jgi:hypothetical protein
VQSGGTVTYSVGTLTPGQHVTATLVAQAPEEGTFADTVSVSTGTTNSNPHHTATATTTMSEDALSLTAASLSGTEFGALSGVTVATFTHAGGTEPPGAFTATINWGDGSSSAGTVGLSGATYFVQGSHTYSTDGSYTVRVTVAEDGGAVSAGASATASIAEAPLPAGISGNSQSSFISETLENAFHQQPSASQINTLALDLFLAEFGLATLLNLLGDGPITAFEVATSAVESQFAASAAKLANQGTSLNTSVSNLGTTFALEGMLLFHPLP